MQKKVYVGLSGGVDSSVAAALLKRDGYSVTGVFIRAWHPDFLECTWKDDRRDAMRVCAALDIPFKEIDLEEEYKKSVVDYLVSEYSKGRTPNPDVMCNRTIKFGGFYDWARKEGADIVATGHYAQTEEGTGRLMTSTDTSKDQTYFLWNVPADRLKNTMFPIGHLQKAEVRKRAEEFGLLTATKKDSQGLCFVGHVDMTEFLERFIPITPGDVHDTDGNVIGTHKGALVYTLGQRHGFTVHTKDTGRDALYVISKDVEKNVIVVGTKEATIENSAIRTLVDVNLIGSAMDETEFDCVARTRYRGALIPCKVHVASSGSSVEFKEAVDALTPGQSVVFYRENECLGGAIIA